MTIKCCVPECRSNYDGEASYTTVFKIPLEKHRPALRQKWLQFINRKNWVPSKRSAVCIKHFREEDVIRFDKFTDSNGIEQTIQRRCPVLKPDAYPTAFPHLTSSLKTEPVTSVKDPNEPASDKCCVPGCRSNYQGQEYVPVFRFPSDLNLKEKWLELIGQRDYVVNKDSVVCAKHFEPHFLITVYHVEQDDGTILCVPRTTPKLQSGALPTIFPHASSSSSATLSRNGKAFNDNKDTNVTGDLEVKQQNCLIKDSITSFHSLCKENDSHIHQQRSKSNLPVISTDDDTSRCAQIIREGHLWTGNTANHRPGFTEMSQNLDIKVELPSLVCDEQSSAVTADITVKKPSHLEHCQTSLELPDSASGGESVSTVSDTSDASQSLAPGQVIGMCYCPQCSTEFPDRSMLYKHFIKAHTSGSSNKKDQANADVCAEYGDKSVNKGGCHEGVTDNRNNEGNQKQTHSCTAKKSHNPDVCSTWCVNVGQLQVCKHEQSGTSARRISDLTEISSQKLMQEKNDVLTVDKLHSEKGNSNETLQETISANEINSEVCRMNKCHTVGDHKTIHIHTSGKRRKLEVSNSGFDQFSKLKAYIRQHMDAKPYHCDVCGARYTSEYILQIHMRKHTGEKPYVCEDCGDRFANRQQLKFHRTSHSGEKPYKCDICESGFNQLYSLQAHMVKHTGVKPFHCEVCGVGFTYKTYLQDHMRKHTGEKPYACDDCGAKFAKRRQLNVHRISHTVDKP